MASGGRELPAPPRHSVHPIANGISSRVTCSPAALGNSARSSTRSVCLQDQDVVTAGAQLGPQDCWALGMLKVLAWIIGIIFLIGLLVVIGVFDLIF